MSAVAGEYTSFRHIKTRKVVVLEIEIPEENFKHAIDILGTPIGGQSKPVGLALLDKTVFEPKKKQTFNELPLTKQAVLLCNNELFFEFTGTFDSVSARDYICRFCGVTSRADIGNDNISTTLFNGLKHRFNSWLTEKQYADNLDREL